MFILTIHTTQLGPDDAAMRTEIADMLMEAARQVLVARYLQGACVSHKGDQVGSYVLTGGMR